MTVKWDSSLLTNDASTGVEDDCNARGQQNESVAVMENEVLVNHQTGASRLLTEHFRCPDGLIDMTVSEGLSGRPGYFRFGTDTICYGQISSVTPADTVSGDLHDAFQDVQANGSSLQLPFDPVQVVNNLRHERYFSDHALGRTANRASGLIRKLYYLARPLLSVAMRKHLQRIYLGDWEDILFPHWPVDSTGENIEEQLLVLAIQSRNLTRIPFILF